MFGHEIVGDWVGESGSEEAQDKAAKKEGYGVGHDLFIDRTETHIMPVEGRAVRSTEQERTDPIGGAKNRNQGPGIVDEGSYHECEKVQTQRPSAEEHHGSVQSVGRGKGNEDPDGEGQRCSLRRFPQMEELFHQRSN